MPEVGNLTAFYGKARILHYISPSLAERKGWSSLVATVPENRPC